MNRVRRVMCTMCQWRMDRCRNARLAVSTAVHGAGTLSPRDAVVSASASADGVHGGYPRPPGSRRRHTPSETFILAWSDTIWRLQCGHVDERNYKALSSLQGVICHEDDLR